MNIFVHKWKAHFFQEDMIVNSAIYFVFSIIWIFLSLTVVTETHGMCVERLSPKFLLVQVDISVTVEFVFVWDIYKKDPFQMR